MRVWWGIASLVVLIAMLVVVMLIANGGVNGDNGVDADIVVDADNGVNFVGGSVTLQPSRFSMFNRTHYYQIPPNPRGTLVVFPGCSRTGTGYWPVGTMPEATGFPEDVSHTKQALGRGLAILVLTPINQKTLCWTNEAGDYNQVPAMMIRFLEDNGLANKPVYIQGASSGGGLAIKLPATIAATNAKLRIDGIISEVSTNQSPLDKSGQRPAIPNFPPVVYIVMERDVQSQKDAQQYVATLVKNGVRAAMVVSPIRKIVPGYYAQRVPGITQAQSQTIVDTLKSIGLVDKNGGLLDDPKNFDKPGTVAHQWMTKLKKVVPDSKTFTLGSVRGSPIFQATAVAYAGHETVSDYTTAALLFFETKDDLGNLVQKYQVSVPTAWK